MATIQFPTDLAIELERFVPETLAGPRKIALRVEYACRNWVAIQEQRVEEQQESTEQRVDPAPP